MNQTVCILGRQPALGIAELEALYGAKPLQPIGRNAVLVDIDAKTVPYERLGGSIKVAKFITYIPSTELPGIVKYLSSILPEQFKHVPSGKISIGLSLYGFQVNPGKINAYALTLKKNLKSAQRGVRIIPNKATELNAAQVIHNDLTGKNGMELLLVKWGKRTVLAQTTAVQDIDAYAARDQARPKRDAKVGMLPPKLAQIIINLAGNHVIPLDAEFDPAHPVNKNPRLARLLDPFCGTGVLLQEALLMGYDVFGTDLEPRMIEYSQVNLDWIAKQRPVTGACKLEVGDATNHLWNGFDVVAAETYLGQPLSGVPKPSVLAEIVQDVDTIHRKFLKNLARQTSQGFRMCIAVPAWKTEQGFKHLPVLDSLEELGYTRESFVHAKNSELLYYREDQVVARELVVLIRK